MRVCSAALIAVLLSAAPAWSQTNGLPADRSAPQRLAPQQRQMLATAARNAATASQLGTLAGHRAEAGRLSELAQAMAATNGGLARQLAQLAGPENMPLRERQDEAELTRLRAMATHDRAAFGRELVAWITAHYPTTIRNVETLGERDPRYAALAEAALPQLREQLAAAQQLAQATAEGEAPAQLR